MNFFKELFFDLYIITRFPFQRSYKLWVPVPGYAKSYEINWDGVIRSKASGKTLSMRIDRAGYYTVRLQKNGKSSTEYVHRLLALAFVPNYHGKKYVNHRKGIKTYNGLENLQWVTHQENILHAYQTGLASNVSQMKKVVNRCTGESYENIKAAAAALGIPYSTCKNYLNGRRPNMTCLELAA